MAPAMRLRSHWLLLLVVARRNAARNVSWSSFCPIARSAASRPSSSVATNRARHAARVSASRSGAAEESVGGGCVAGAAAVARANEIRRGGPFADPGRERRGRLAADVRRRSGSGNAFAGRGRLARRLGVGGGERIRRGSVGGPAGTTRASSGKTPSSSPGWGDSSAEFGEDALNVLEAARAASTLPSMASAWAPSGGTDLGVRSSPEEACCFVPNAASRSRGAGSGLGTLASANIGTVMRHSRRRARWGARAALEGGRAEEPTSAIERSVATKTDNWDNCPTTTLRDRARARARVPSRAPSPRESVFTRALDTGVPRRSKSAAVRRPPSRGGDVRDASESPRARESPRRESRDAAIKHSSFLVGGPPAIFSSTRINV